MRAHLATLIEDFRRHSRETAVVAHRGNRTYRTTYGELAELSGRFAAELDRRAIAPGERIVLWGANSAEWISAFFGCLLRGVIAVPLDAAGSPEFAARVVKDVSPKLIVGDHHLINSISAHLDISAIPQILLADLASQLPSQPNFLVSSTVTKDAPFQIVFTSGTTSEPKGIVHTHRNVLASVAPIEHEMKRYSKYERWVHPLRFLHTLPLSHVFGQFMGLWLPPLLAGELHFAEGLEARRMTELIRRERISVLVAVPRILQLLRAHLLGRFSNLQQMLDQSSSHSLLKAFWRYRKVRRALGFKFWAVISGGAALPAELEEFWNRLGIALIQGYGMTETTALVTLNHPFKIAQGTIGKTLPGREVKLSDDGEILVRGDMLASGTWKNGHMNPRESEWLATGDLGEKNDSGELRYLGRKGDVIVNGSGMNVHPDDLESAMKQQAVVKDCVVVPCEMLGGSEPVAVVISSVTEDQLHQAVVEANRGLADYQQIRRILKWPEPQFPYTTTGKLLRRKVNEWVCQTVVDQQRQQSGPHSASTGSDILLDLIADVTGERAPSAGNDLRLAEDLHLDSLGRVQLQTALEQRLDLELPDDALASVETLGDLRAIIDAEATAPPTDHAEIPAGATHSLTSSMPITPGETQNSSPPQPAPPARPLTQNDDQKALTSEHLYPYWPWRWPFHAIRAAFIELLMRPLVRLLGKPRVVLPAAGLPPGPLLIIANHVTAMDGPLVLYALPGRLRRNLAVAMSGEMLLDFRRGRNQPNKFLDFFAPPQYWLVTAFFNVFPLPRLHGFRKSFSHAGEAMDRGYSVLVFPEGARSFDGGMRPFRQGIGLLAQESRVPVVPVALTGLEQAHRTGWFRSGLLEIRVGEAITLPSDPGDIDPAELTARLEAAMRTLIGAGQPAEESSVKPTKAAD